MLTQYATNALHALEVQLQPKQDFLSFRKKSAASGKEADWGWGNARVTHVTGNSNGHIILMLALLRTLVRPV